MRERDETPAVAAENEKDEADILADQDETDLVPDARPHPTRSLHPSGTVPDR